MFTILGSGFGLYGYLPALINEWPGQVILPERYRARFNARAELAHLASRIEWERDEASVLVRVDGVVCALRPMDQRGQIARCLAMRKISRMLFEKPLAQSPEAASSALGDLIRSGRTFRIAYTFQFTDWGQRLLAALRSPGDNGPVCVRWDFMAHHFRQDLNNWKRLHSMGGGAIRFYGIHIIALLAKIGYCDVISSQAFGAAPNEIEKWSAVMAGPGLPECRVAVDSRCAASRFHIEQKGPSSHEAAIIYASGSDPFEPAGEADPADKTDRRIPVLSRFCRSLREECPGEYEWYDAVNRLWRDIESRTEFPAN